MPTSTRSALFVVLAAACSSQGGQSSGGSPAAGTRAERLFQDAPAVWFEEYYSRLQVSADGRQALYATPFNGRIRLIDLRSGSIEAVGERNGVSDIGAAAFGPEGGLMLHGTRSGRSGWYRASGSAAAALPLPEDARPPAWSADGRKIAFLRRSVVDSIFVGTPGHSRAYPAAGTVLGFTWLPGDSALLVLTLDSGGPSTLSRLEVTTARSQLVARDLDPPTFDSPLAIAPDGRHVYIALASARAPVPEVRHRPSAPRQLGIYEVDLGNGTRRAVVPPTPGTDAFAPFVAAGSLYWIQATTDASIVVLPIAGGNGRMVAHDAMIPSWRPDGRRVGFAMGQWRLADWAFNWDGGAVDVDSEGAVTGRPEAVIVGYHEDFQPVWSPDGQWIAYHSHRAAAPVATYFGNNPDDIWLRRPDAPARDTDEIRVTDFGDEANSPDWSPDGTRLVFTSYDKNGTPGVSYPYIVTIETTTGRALRHERLALPREIENTAWVAWSPVRDEIAVESDLGHGHHEIWIVPVGRGVARKVVGFPLTTFGGVSWTPKGETLVYTSLTEGRMQLFAVSATGGTPRQLTHDSANVFTPRVSPDGRKIAATRLQHRKEIWRLSVAKD
jgi:Tol biopolymer transport system component